MFQSSLPYFGAAIPEIFLAVMSLIILLIGVFREGEGNVRFISMFSVITLTVTALMIINVDIRNFQDTFNGLFVMDSFGAFTKILALVGAGLSIVLSVSYLEKEQIGRFEFPVLILLSSLGMMMMISASDLMALYIGLELQSLPLYVLAAFRRDNLRSSEAGMKYFVLGALSSGMLLYGMSLVYGFTGTTGFSGIGEAITALSGQPSTGLTVGLVFVLAGLAFKISAVPFHMWTPDVYEGSPTAVTALFAIAPKVAAVALLLRLLSGPFGVLFEQWQQIIVALSVASMLVGSLGAITQRNIKRLMAYSSIGHIGYILIAFAAGTAEAAQSILVYLVIYMVMNAGVFAVILSMRRGGRATEEISDLSGLSRTQPLMALALAILMFSMTGIPPMAGFFGKLFVFKAAVNAGLFKLAVIGVVTSVIAAYYYLRIIKVMYFDQPAEAFDHPVVPELRCIAALSVFFIMLFIVFPNAVLHSTQWAVTSLGLS